MSCKPVLQGGLYRLVVSKASPIGEIKRLKAKDSEDE